MSKSLEFEEHVDQLWFQLEDNDYNAKEELLHRISDLISNIPGNYRAPDENTKITLRMFTRRC